MKVVRFSISGQELGRRERTEVLPGRVVEIKIAVDKGSIFIHSRDSRQISELVRVTSLYILL